MCGSLIWTLAIRMETKRGRPPTGGHQCSVYLDDKTVADARDIGYGNLSLGLRIAVQAYIAQDDEIVEEIKRTQF